MLAQSLRDLPGHDAAFAHFEGVRPPRVERIIRWAARINSSKAAGPVGSLFRDAMLPAILKLTADSKAHRETYEFRIHWDAAAA